MRNSAINLQASAVLEKMSGQIRVDAKREAILSHWQKRRVGDGADGPAVAGNYWPRGPARSCATATSVRADSSSSSS